MKEVRITIDLNMKACFMADDGWDEDRCIQYVLDHQKDFDIQKYLSRSMEAEFTGYAE